MYICSERDGHRPRSTQTDRAKALSEAKAQKTLPKQIKIRCDRPSAVSDQRGSLRVVVKK